MPDADNDSVPPRNQPDPNAHGEAALLLVESLIHTLVARSGLTLVEAIETVDAAMDVQVEIGEARGDHPADTLHATRHLSTIKDSLGIDIV